MTEEFNEAVSTMPPLHQPSLVGVKGEDGDEMFKLITDYAILQEVAAVALAVHAHVPAVALAVHAHVPAVALATLFAMIS